MSGRGLAPPLLVLAGWVAACTDPHRAAEPAASTTPVEAPQPAPSASRAPPPPPPAPAAASPAVAASTGVPPEAAAPPVPREAVVPESGVGPSPTASSPTASSLAAQAPAAASTGTPSTTDLELAPALLAADGTPLPQTRERPDTTSPGFQRRLELLVDAIAHDDPERALPAFFPAVAYQLVKAIPNPGRDWETRLVRAFRRDIHDYHRLLGPDAAGARLAGIVTNERAVRWMEPGAEGNRVGYHRVTRSRLKVHLAKGGTRELELTSLISWRGAWYIVHLHGFS